MKKITLIIGILISNLLGANIAYNFDFNAVVEQCIADGTLDGTVKFYLAGNDINGLILKKGIVANKKTNGFMKSPEFSCDWVLRSNLIYLQAAAKKRGANAVINIISYYKSKPSSSSKTYECHKGNAITGVALKGDLAITGNKSNLPGIQSSQKVNSKQDTLSDIEIIQLYQKVKSFPTFTSLIPKNIFSLNLTFDYEVLNTDSVYSWRLESITDTLGLYINLKNSDKNKKLVRNIALKNSSYMSVPALFLHTVKENGLNIFVFEAQ